MFWSILVMILLVLVAWIMIDLTLGKKQHNKLVKSYEEPPIRKSDAHFFSHGDKLFDHMFKEIEKATDHIHMQFYIFRDDSIGTKMIDNLKKKSREGVTVRLMVDWIGSKISKKARKELKEAGIIFKRIHVPSFPFLFYSLNQRNHRKITVIDGKTAYIGGYNVGDEYLGRDPKMGRWRDYHLYLIGEAVGDLQKQFLMDWNKAKGESVLLNDNYFPPLMKGKLDVQIAPTNGSHIKEKMMSLLSKAKKSVLIGTPYFIPGKEMVDELISLAKKGVYVQILIPKYPDHPLVKDAAYPYLQPLIEGGVEVRQFYEGFYHSKAIIIDANIVDIGTANFDKRSFHLNYEVNCIIHNDEWIRDVKEEIEKDFYESSEKITLDHIEKRTLFEKTKEKFASAISPIL
ncbi:cardiolipin synthase [Evansella sp. AB-P1]|uniref:cardiolipin synthase n=1 Tax=Evansella sp. AB-P1 TaxID=3037653 RepID=UPI00241EC95E|nr:cardiolipin synthase [Evansella sp. AB-P1]MDG5787364.1 cardiolipin synthase [Evansella sp. AB-P1]